MPAATRAGAGALPAPSGLPVLPGNPATTDARISAREEDSAALRQARAGKITSSVTAFKPSTT